MFESISEAFTKIRRVVSLLSGNTADDLGPIFDAPSPGWPNPEKYPQIVPIVVTLVVTFRRLACSRAGQIAHKGGEPAVTGDTIVQRGIGVERTRLTHVCTHIIVVP